MLKNFLIIMNNNYVYDKTNYSCLTESSFKKLQLVYIASSLLDSCLRRNDNSVSKLLNTYGYKKNPPLIKKQGRTNKSARPCQQTDCYIHL